MANLNVERNRYFLKDTIRKQIDFRLTAQNRGIPPPPLQKACPEECCRVELPAPELIKSQVKMDVFTAIQNRSSCREFSTDSLSLVELSFLLWASQGVRRVVDAETALRTVPSAGGRHPFETYLNVRQVEGIEPGLYRYLPFDGQLAYLKVENHLSLLISQACFGQEFCGQAAVTFFWTVIPYRMEWRYGLAAHKVIAIDAGHVCQNLYLACAAINVGICAVAAYDQEVIDRLLGVDGQDEFTVYIAAVGYRSTGN